MRGMNTLAILLSPERILLLKAIISERASSSSVMAGVKLVYFMIFGGGGGGGRLFLLTRDVRVAWEVSDALEDIMDLWSESRLGRPCCLTDNVALSEYLSEDMDGLGAADIVL